VKPAAAAIVEPGAMIVKPGAIMKPRGERRMLVHLCDCEAAREWTSSKVSFTYILIHFPRMKHQLKRVIFNTSTLFYSILLGFFHELPTETFLKVDAWHKKFEGHFCQSCKMCNKSCECEPRIWYDDDRYDYDVEDLGECAGNFKGNKIMVAQLMDISWSIVWPRKLDYFLYYVQRMRNRLPADVRVLV